MNARRLRALTRFILIGWAGLILPACSHYRLGTGDGDPGFRSLYVAPVGNDAAVPQAVPIVSRELRDAFLRDGRIRLARSAESADAVLTVMLTDYSRSFTAVQPNDTALARKFDLALSARCTLVDRRTGEALFSDRVVSVTRQIYVDSGQNPAETEALPHLADQLADWVAHAALGVW